MKHSFKKRISVYNTVAVAITTGIVFVIVYAVVHFTAYQHLDSDIILEKDEILHALATRGDSIEIYNMPEWEEAEHSKVEVNPTFIQIVDQYGQIIFKSSNLQDDHFLYNPVIDKDYYFNTQIGNQKLRLGQFPILNLEGKIIGQLSVGISQQESASILKNLMLVMGVTFFLVIFIMYLVIFFSVSKAIAPVEKLIQTTSIINDTNLGIRLSLPKHEDELHQLALTINELLDRLDRSILGQKQFTSDASHEIRTPLASIRGTLEILIRKKREPEEYESKIAEVISQTDRLTALLDQLLQLARLESVSIQGKKLLLNSIVEDSISKFSNHFRSKNIHYDFAVLGQFYVHGDSILLGIIIDNLIGNAIKYGKQGGELTIIIEERTRTLHVSNSGETMNTEQLSLLFNRFYRVDHSRSSGIPGSGLGLAIVKKLADLHDIEISVSSHDGINTFSLTFPEIL